MTEFPARIGEHIKCKYYSARLFFWFSMLLSGVSVGMEIPLNC